MITDKRSYYGIAPILAYGNVNVDESSLYSTDITANETETAWQGWFHQYAPNGVTLRDHSLFEEIDSRGELTLLHITTAFEKMKQSGYVYPSGGSLGCTVYCVPLRLGDKMHNLTKFILNYEMPMSLKARNLVETTKVDMIAIRIKRESVSAMDSAANGMDHLLLGELQADAYDRFIEAAKVDHEIQDKLEFLTLQKIQQNADFLNLCQTYQLNDISNEEFFERMYQLLESVGFFGYVYFETLIEYLSLYQNDAESAVLKEAGEINSNSKRLIFEIAPHLLSSFRLPTFRPTIPELIEYLKSASQDGRLVIDFDPAAFEKFMKWRFAQNVRHKILQGEKLDDVRSFVGIKHTHKSLLGHVIRTEIGVMPELKDVASLYDVARADLIRDGWNQYKVLFPYNAIIPKGEVGINPGFPGLSYTVYGTKFDSHTGTVELQEELPLKLATELIDPRFGSLRFQAAK